MEYEDHFSRSSQEMELHHHHHQFHHPHSHLVSPPPPPPPPSSSDHHNPHQHLRSSIHSPPDTPTSAAGNHPSPPPWLLNSLILGGNGHHHHHQPDDVAATSNFLHQLQASNEGPVSLDPSPPHTSSSMNMHKRFKDGSTNSGGGGDHNSNGEASAVAAAAAAAEVLNDEWERDRCKAEILNHPLYDQLLAAHVYCLRIATPVDQLPRIDAQLAQSQHVVAKYSSVLRGHDPQLQALDDKDLDHFMAPEGNEATEGLITIGISMTVTSKEESSCSQ